MKTINRLLDKSRLFEILRDRLPNSIIDSDLYKKTADYLDLYVIENKLCIEEIIAAYETYVSNFNKHCKAFIRTGEYPLHLGTDISDISREEYDLVLILSVLLTAHRFRIMEIIDNSGRSGGTRLFVGAGPGLELYLSENLDQENYVYDVSLNEGLKEIFPKVKFFTDYFSAQYTDYFDSIFLIEILEHLDDPIELLRNALLALKEEGLVYLTTATDIPQFDHLYNFPEDHTEFDLKIADMGFEIMLKEKISHEYLLMNVSPSNHFYILKKTNNRL